MTLDFTPAAAGEENLEYLGCTFGGRAARKFELQRQGHRARVKSAIETNTKELHCTRMLNTTRTPLGSNVYH